MFGETRQTLLFLLLCSKMKEKKTGKDTDKMKAYYEAPEIEILHFESEDVIATSGDPELPMVPFE